MNSYLIIAIILATILLLVMSVLAFYFFKTLERVKKRNIDLSVRNTSLEMHRLKYSLQPHTLNNILEHLQAMSSKINRSIDSLSKTLEYIFYHGEEHLVSIEEEVKFIENYVELQRVFITGIDSIDLNTDELNINSKKYTEQSIPHLITAYLIENAFKHGDTKHPDFLKVTIGSSDKEFFITVVNKIIKKNNSSARKGTGLINMRKRLKVLKEGKYTFETDQIDDDFVAKMIINI